MRAAQPDHEYGITLNLYPVDPASDRAEDVAVARQVDGQCNRLFLDPVLRGSYPDDVLASFEPISGLEHIHDGDAARHRGAARRARDQLLQPAHGRGGRPTGRGGPRQLPARAGLGRRAPRGQGRHRAAEDGDGLGDRPDRARRDAGAPCRGEYDAPPLYVTENGAAFPDVVTADGEVDDADRVAFLDGHLRAAKQAIDQGVDLRGYFAWSLLDNFEWAWGYDRRFGIVRVDYDTQVRTVKASGRWYAAVVARNTIDAG